MNVDNESTTADGKQVRILFITNLYTKLQISRLVEYIMSNGFKECLEFTTACPHGSHWPFD